MTESIKNVDNLQQSIESWITNIDSLSIYNLDRLLSPVCKSLKIDNIKLDNLISLEPLVNESNLIVERDLTSGQIIDYYENFNHKSVINEALSVDPELLHKSELVFEIPGVFSGIDFSNRNDVEMGKDEKDELVEINIFSDLTNDDKLVFNVEIVEKKEDLSFAEDVDNIIENENVEEFWSKQGLSKLNTFNLKLVGENKEKKWAVRASEKDVKEYDKIRANLAYQWKFELDPFQKQAVFLMENSECVFVAAHTSAGKTVVAEYAIALAFKHKTKVIYTSPIKALSNQKFREFKTIFNDVGLITGDIQIAPEASCLIMTTEILRSMLYKRSETLRDLEWVIFDEVHYMNDAMRGVVWEETLILLPDHINIVMLSATIPNYFDFAEWVGKIKQRNIYVMSTPKRPVPLEHYIYTGNSTKTSDELFLLIDANEKYLTHGYTKALEAKKVRTKASNTNYGAKGTNQKATPAQEKNIWISLIGMLSKRELLPIVSFVFSRKRCDDNINMLSSMDLNTQAEKSEVHQFIQKSIMSLSKEDRHIPQILHLSESLKRGIGVHHSGILPLMKEIIELLFQRGLIKILFATETFAMGINMPARTVIFDSIRKHDGEKFRSLNAGEYIQMAGRAGRRGLDSTGTVIMLCKNEVPEASELQAIMRGAAASLESKFRLTYSMILSLLRQKDIRIQDFMKRSFFEHKFTSTEDPALYESAIKYLNERKNLLEDEKNVQKLHYLNCTFCSNNIFDYYESCSSYKILKNDLYSSSKQVLIKRKILVPGRIVLVKGYKIEEDNTFTAKLYPILLLQELSETNEVLAMSLDSLYFDSRINQIYPSTKYIYDGIGNFEKLIEKLKNFEQINVELPFLKSSLALFKDFKNATIIKIKFEHIEAITNKLLKHVGSNLNSIIDCYYQVLYQVEQHSKEFNLILRQELIKNTLFNGLVLELFSYVENYMNEIENDSLVINDLIDFMKDLNIRDVSFIEFYDEFNNIQLKLSKFKCLQCPNFSDHFQQIKINRAIDDRVSYINNVVSGNTLLLVSEYRYRIEVLKKLRLIDEKNFVLLKGKVALEISVLELFLTEIIIENVFSNMSSNEIVALLSSVVYQGKSSSKDEHGNLKTYNNIILDQGRDHMIDIAIKINRIQSDCEIQVVGSDDFLEQLNFGLVEVVYEWSKGTPFATIKKMTEEQEGIIVRTIQRLDETCSNLKDAAKIIGDTVLESKMEQCSTIIRRDIVFAGSLYTKTEVV